MIWIILIISLPCAFFLWLWIILKEDHKFDLTEESIELIEQIKDVRIPSGKSHTITITGANKPLFTEDDKEIVEELNKYINKQNK